MVTYVRTFTPSRCHPAALVPLESLVLALHDPVSPQPPPLPPLFTCPLVSVGLPHADVPMSLLVEGGGRSTPSRRLLLQAGRGLLGWDGVLCSTPNVAVVLRLCYIRTPNPCLLVGTTGCVSILVHPCC